MRLVQNPIKNALLNIKTDLYSVFLLVSSLGLMNGLKVGLRTKSRIKNNDIGKKLGPITDAKDAMSRMQFIPAILLFEELLKVTGKSQSLEVLGKIISQGAVFFINTLVPTITKDQYHSHTEEEKKSKIGELAGLFPNTEISSYYGDEKQFGFRVSKCSFASYCKRLDYPELASLFCKGDMDYFESDKSNIRLIRPQTLADGGECCEFDFVFKD